MHSVAFPLASTLTVSPWLPFLFFTKVPLPRHSLERNAHSRFDPFSSVSPPHRGSLPHYPSHLLALLLSLLPSRIPILQRLLEAAPLPTSNRDDLEWTLSFDAIRRYNVLCRPLPCPGPEPAAPGEPLVSPVARICQARDRIDDPRTFQGFAMVPDTAIFRSRESAIIRPNFHLRKMVLGSRLEDKEER